MNIQVKELDASRDLKHGENIGRVIIFFVRLYQKIGNYPFESAIRSIYNIEGRG